MKAILLARVSTDEQETDGQLLKLKDYAEKENFTYSEQDIFDFHESAYKTQREKFDEVIKHVQSQKEKQSIIEC